MYCNFVKSIFICSGYKEPRSHVIVNFVYVFIELFSLDWKIKFEKGVEILPEDVKMYCSFKYCSISTVSVSESENLLISFFWYSTFHLDNITIISYTVESLSTVYSFFKHPQQVCKLDNLSTCSQRCKYQV